MSRRNLGSTVLMLLALVPVWLLLAVLGLMAFVQYAEIRQAANAVLP